MKILITTLDGTIRRPSPNAAFTGKKRKFSGPRPETIQKPTEQEVIPETLKLLEKYEEHLIVGVTNQEYASDSKGMRNCVVEQMMTLKLVPQISRIFFCADQSGDMFGVVYPEYWSGIIQRPDGFESFKLPDIGMIEYISREFGSEQMSLMSHNSEYEQTAKLAGIDFIPVNSEAAVSSGQ